MKNIVPHKRVIHAVQAEWGGVSPERQGVSQATSLIKGTGPVILEVLSLYQTEPSRRPGVVDVVPVLPGWLEICQPPGGLAAKPEVIVCPHSCWGRPAFSPDRKLLAIGGSGATHVFDVSKH